MKQIPVSRLLEKEADLALTVLARGESLHRLVGSPRIQKPGLALAGFTEHTHAERVQILGQMELAYLNSLEEDQKRNGIRMLLEQKPCAVIITRNLPVHPEFVKMSEENQVPLFSTPLMSSVLISRITKFLEMELAPSASIHGVLVDVWGVGILLLGKSGIGKSEMALDLVLRGHRLVTDDVVQVHKILPDRLYGSGAELLKHHLEIRGLGILNIKDLFGVASVRDRKRIELVIEMVEWDPKEPYDRLGTEERRYAILDVAVPLLRIPVRMGRNTCSVVEVAARNQLLKRQGTHSARMFQEILRNALQQKQPGSSREGSVE